MRDAWLPNSKIKKNVMIICCIIIALLLGRWALDAYNKKQHYESMLNEQAQEPFYELVREQDLLGRIDHELRRLLTNHEQSKKEDALNKMENLLSVQQHAFLLTDRHIRQLPGYHEMDAYFTVWAKMNEFVQYLKQKDIQLSNSDIEATLALRQLVATVRSEINDLAADFDRDDFSLHDEEMIYKRILAMDEAIADALINDGLADFAWNQNGSAENSFSETKQQVKDPIHKEELDSSERQARAEQLLQAVWHRDDLLDVSFERTVHDDLHGQVDLYHSNQSAYAVQISKTGGLAFLYYEYHDRDKHDQFQGAISMEEAKTWSEELLAILKKTVELSEVDAFTFYRAEARDGVLDLFYTPVIDDILYSNRSIRLQIDKTNGQLLRIVTEAFYANPTIDVTPTLTLQDAVEQIHPALDPIVEDAYLAVGNTASGNSQPVYIIPVRYPDDIEAIFIHAETGRNEGVKE